MPTLKRKGQYESPQASKDEMSTPYYGGDNPDDEDIVKSANARSTKRHEVKGDEVADENVLPSSGGEVLDKAGIKDNGYLTKKNLPFGVAVFYNTLPPGMDIEDQELADIRTQPFKQITDLSYPGDGWT
jgi:hypothetical protein